jgi:methionyl-tRNA formyltransferase
MNITLLINHDLAATLALNYLLPKLSVHKLNVFFTRKSSTKERPAALSELAEYEARCLAQLNSQADNGRLESIEQLNAPAIQAVECLNDVNGSGFATLQASQPDLILSIRHMTILRETVIRLPKHGVINLHSGMLPAYQGVMASFWAMLHKEKSLATTLHFIDDAQIDTGALIEQLIVECKIDKSYLWNVLNLYDSGCKTILRTVDRIDTGEPVASTQQSGSACYFSYPEQSDLNRFNALGLRLFDQSDAKEFGFGQY